VLMLLADEPGAFRHAALAGLMKTSDEENNDAASGRTPGS